MITYNNLAEEKYDILRREKISGWIIQVIENEQYRLGLINYIFVRDEQLLEINMQFLQHNTYTDIITFPQSTKHDILSGEIYISLDRVLENAKTFNVPLTKEFSRVLVHGVLHLMGYQDKTEKEKKIMRAKEDYYINLQPNSFGELFHVKQV